MPCPFIFKPLAGKAVAVKRICVPTAKLVVRLTASPSTVQLNELTGLEEANLKPSSLPPV